MAIRIPTGPVPKNTARNISFVLGVISLAVHIFAPQFVPFVTELGSYLLPLGLTLGKADLQ